jgi:hypothetical protein
MLKWRNEKRAELLVAFDKMSDDQVETLVMTAQKSATRTQPEKPKLRLLPGGAAAASGGFFGA